MDDSQDIVKRTFSLQDFVGDALARRVNPVAAYFTRVATERLREVAPTRFRKDIYIGFHPLRTGRVRVDARYLTSAGASPQQGSAEFGSIREAVEQINQLFFTAPSETAAHMDSLLVAPPKKPKAIDYKTGMYELYSAIVSNTDLDKRCRAFKDELKAGLGDALIARWREKKGDAEAPDYSLVVNVEPAAQIDEKGNVPVVAQIDWFRLDPEFKNWARQRLEPLASRKIIEDRKQKYTVEAPTLETLVTMLNQQFRTNLGDCQLSTRRG